MKYYWLTLIAIFTVSMAEAQMADPSVTNKQAREILKDEQKKAQKNRSREEIAKNEKEERIETRPQYKRVFRFKKRRAKEKDIKPRPTPSKTTDY